MKKSLLSLYSLILFIFLSSNGGQCIQETSMEPPQKIYDMHTNLFVIELTQEIPQPEKDMVSPFIIIPHISPKSSEGQLKLLRSLFNFKEIILKEESKELEWRKLQGPTGKAIFPRIVQAFKMEGNEYEITLFPVENKGLPGFKIHVSLVKSLPEDKGKALYPLKAIYDELSGGRIFRTEIRDIGNLFFICFPTGKKIYVLSVYHIVTIAAYIYRPL